MRTSTVLLAAGLSATAHALQANSNNNNNNNNNNAPAALLKPRDTEACTSVAAAILPRITDGVPTPPADVVSYLALSATITDPCSDPTITGSIGSAFSTYAASYTSWRNEHIGDFRSLWQACSDVPLVASVLPTGTGQCSSIIAEITSAGPANPTSNGGGGGGGSGSQGTDTPNAAMPRETGAVMAAAAVAGLVVAAFH